MKHKKIKLKTVDGFSIAGTHTITKGKSVILWLHGIAVDKDEFLNFFKDGSEFMGEIGIDSLRIDFRGHGNSSGKSADFTITGQMIDIDSAIKYLKDFYEPEKLNLHLVGCSFGAPPSIFTTALHADLVKSIILIAPVLSYQRTFLRPETEWAAEIFNEKTIAKLYKTNKLKIDSNFSISMQLYKEMQLIQPNEFIGNLDKTVTVIHGDLDSMVPYSVSKDLSKKFNNINLISIPKMDHGFNDSDDEKGTSEKSQNNKRIIYEQIKKAVTEKE